MQIEDATLMLYSVYIDIGKIKFPFQLTLLYTRLMYKEKWVRLYWGFVGGTDRSIPRNPQETPRKAPGNPLGT